jgi:hypothetical protein
MRSNSNHLNRELDCLIGTLQERYAGSLRAVGGYDGPMLASRLAQRVLEISHAAYARAAGLRLPADNAGPLLPLTPMFCPGANVYAGGAIRITVPLSVWMKAQAVFVAHWVYCLGSILFPQMAGRGATETTLVYGVGEESLFQEGNDHAFVEFCDKGPVAPLQRVRLLVQSSQPARASSSSRFSYWRNPLTVLIRTTAIGFAARMRLLAVHIALLPRWLLASAQAPELSLLARDFPYTGMVRALDRAGILRDIVCTISSYGSQPLWMRGLSHTKVHMVWYAQNWKPIRWMDEPLDSDIVELPHIAVDAHWVWTHSFAAYLSTLLPKAACHVVGPLLWYLPVSVQRPTDVISISVFDVPPYADAVALAYGEFPNYNHPRNLFAFIRDVLALATRLKAELGVQAVVSLKTKRGYNAAYDRPYFDHLESLAAQGQIRLRHHSTNLYSMIVDSHLVLAYPFTSPAYVAAHLGVPAIYHDPTGAILRQDFSDLPDGLPFTSSGQALFEEAKALLGKHGEIAGNWR